MYKHIYKYMYDIYPYIDWFLGGLYLDERKNHWLIQQIFTEH